MSLTAAQMAICAMIFGVSVGSVGTIGAQQVAAAKAKPKAAKTKPRPAIKKPAPAPQRDRAAILDCPTPGLSAAPWGEPFTLSQPEATPLAPLGGVVPPSAPPSFSSRPPSAAPAAPPAVPEPVSWAMLVTGFGLVGLAFRKNTTPQLTKDPKE